MIFLLQQAHKTKTMGHSDSSKDSPRMETTNYPAKGLTSVKDITSML